MGMVFPHSTKSQNKEIPLFSDYLPCVFSAGKILLGEKTHFTCQLSYLDCQLKFNTLIFLLCLDWLIFPELYLKQISHQQLI